jgi:carboxyl-terminal processing protease
MNRERIAWLLSLVLLASVAFLRPSSAQRDSDYRFVRTLVDIQRLVAGNYVENVPDDKLEQGAIDGLLGQLDPFTAYVPPARREAFDRMLEGTFRGVGIELDQATPNGPIVIVTPIDGSPAFKAGVMPGDVIVKVNGESVEGMNVREVMKKIAGDADTEVRLGLKRDEKVIELSMRRQEIVVPTVKGYARNPDNTWDYFVVGSPRIAYLRITQFTPSTFDHVRGVLEELLRQGMSGLVLDLRWNPGGQLDQAVQVVDLFVKSGVIVSIKGENRPEKIEQAREEGTLPWFPMIVLVNEHSASAAEIVAGSLMDAKRAAVLGQRSYGKGSVQEVIPLEGNNGELKLTVAYYYLPSGRLVHKKKDAATWGVEPQIAVPMSKDQEQRVVAERMEQERIRRPGGATTPSTRPAGSPPATSPATRPVDVQLQRAIDTILLMTVMKDQAPRPAVARSPSTRPAGGAQDHQE